jgi:uncharacterized protein
MIMQFSGRSFPAVLVVALLPGCVSLGRDSPPLELYVIGGAPPPAVAAPLPGLADITVGLRRLHLAPYLATPAIVVRRGPHEILTSDYHRWGEDVAEGINRAVARYLADGAQLGTVDVAPWPARARYDYLVQLRVTRFEGVIPAASPAGVADDPEGAMGAVHMEATWEIIRQQDETVLTRGTTDFREDTWRVGDYAALVALLDRGLVVLARDLTVALGGLVAAGPAPEQGSVGGMSPLRTPAHHDAGGAPAARSFGGGQGSRLSVVEWQGVTNLDKEEQP